MTKEIDKTSAWDEIQSGAWRGIYLRELYTLAHDSCVAAEEVFQSERVAPFTGIDLSRDLNPLIYRILNNAARIRAMIHARPRRAKQQSAALYAIQSRRTAWLSALLSGIETSEIIHARVRNSLEHFDEFLDQTALRLTENRSPKVTFVPMDMYVSHSGFWAEEFGADYGVYALRVYYIQPRIFENCGVSINIGLLAEQCEKVRERIRQHIDPDMLGEDGYLSSAAISFV